MCSVPLRLAPAEPTYFVHLSYGTAALCACGARSVIGVMRAWYRCALRLQGRPEFATQAWYRCALRLRRPLRKIRLYVVRYRCASRLRSLFEPHPNFRYRCALRLRTPSPVRKSTSPGTAALAPAGPATRTHDLRYRCALRLRSLSRLGGNSRLAPLRFALAGPGLGASPYRCALRLLGRLPGTVALCAYAAWRA